MAPTPWLQELAALHERAKRGELNPSERAAYLAGRDQLAAVIAAAQRVATPPGQTPRRALRISRAFQVEIEFFDGAERAVTLQISSGGFGALLAKPPAANTEVPVTLRLPGGDRLRCKARVVESQVQGGAARVSFRFVDMAPDHVERLEMLVFDTLLAQLLQG